MYISSEGQITADKLPPCSDSLQHHAKRANYQIAVWRRALEANSDIPGPIGHGWFSEDNGYGILWNSIGPAPDEILSLIVCGCLRKCVAGSCSCIDNNLKCTETCHKHNCDNENDDTTVNGYEEFSDDDEDL